jgi:hypothetical protein
MALGGFFLLVSLEEPRPGLIRSRRLRVELAISASRFRARSSFPGYPGAGSLAAAAGASKKKQGKKRSKCFQSPML